MPGPSKKRRPADAQPKPRQRLHIRTLFQRAEIRNNSVVIIHAFSYKQRFFSTQPQCCLTFSWIECQMLVRCCLIHISIITLRHFLHLLYLCPCLYIGLFMPYLWDLFFIFAFIFIVTNRIISWIQTHLFFCLFLRMSYYFWMITWMKNVNNFQIAKVQLQGVA